jgi:hypothetical protein
MSELPERQHPIDGLVSDIERRQRNTLFPDVMVNSSSADALMWNGSPRITKVQRIGVGLFGLTFLSGGIILASLVDGFWLGYLIAAGFVGAGCKLLWNSVRKNKPSAKNR